jgi:hypothetical protein
MTLVFFLTLLAPVVLVAAVVIGLMHLRARAYARSVRARLERAAADPGDEVVLSRGKLVVEGEGCATELDGPRRKIAARTTWGSRRRLWHHKAAAGAGERAAVLYLDPTGQRLKLEGPVVVSVGSRLRFQGYRGALDAAANLFDVTATLEDGDEVLVLGRRRDDAESRPDGAEYRKGAARAVLEPQPDTGTLELCAAGPPRVSCRWQPVARMAVPAALFAIVPGWYLAKEYDKTEKRCAEVCPISGDCHVDTRLRHEGLEALKKTVTGDVFTCAAHEDVDCRASSSCTNVGQCTPENGRCVVKTDDDCRFSRACFDLGWCSKVGGECRAAKDEDCAATESCQTIGWCSVVGGECRRGPSYDCRSRAECYERGQCTLVGAECKATSDEDCKKSSDCDHWHRCTLQGDACVATADDCKASDDCLIYGRCSVVSEFCRVASDDDCRQSDGCAGMGQCRNESESCRGYAPCAESDACRFHGRCGGGDAICEARSDRDCAQSLGCKEHGACKRFGSECAASCAASLGCKLRGTCTESDGRCVVGSAEDCKKSVDCDYWGGCSVVDGRCQLTDADCARHPACKGRGACSASGGSCVAETDADCRQSAACQRSGACSAVNYSCRVAKDDCKGTEACKNRGYCTASTSGCELGTDDCRELRACKDAGRCSVVHHFAPKCLAASDLDCKSSSVCQRFGWCTEVEGTCYAKRR